MAIKRYTPKYKKLHRLRQAFWLEKGPKIKKFKKQKWENLKEFYYPKRYRFYNQDKSAYPVSWGFEDEKSIRLKKTYKFLLLDKQRLQLYYGAGRLKHYQLKSLVSKAQCLGKKDVVSPARRMLFLVENRLQNLLYRLGFVSSLMEARRFVQSGHIKISGDVIKNCAYLLKKFDILKLDPAKSYEIIARYLKQNILVFYFKRRKLRRRAIYKRRQTFVASAVSINSYNVYHTFKEDLNCIAD